MLKTCASIRVRAYVPALMYRARRKTACTRAAVCIFALPFLAIVSSSPARRVVRLSSRHRSRRVALLYLSLSFKGVTRARADKGDDDRGVAE